MTYGPWPVFDSHSIHPGASSILVAGLLLGISGVGSAAEPSIDPVELQSLRDMRSVVLSVAAYQIDNGTVPGPTDGLVTTEFLLPYVEPVYIRSLPTSDGWGQPFHYWSDGDRFGLVSYGPDGFPDRAYIGAIEFEDGGDDLVILDGAMAAVPLHLRPDDPWRRAEEHDGRPA